MSEITANTQATAEQKEKIIALVREAARDIAEISMATENMRSKWGSAATRNALEVIIENMPVENDSK
jgi:hypothetical protein